MQKVIIQVFLASFIYLANTPVFGVVHSQDNKNALVDKLNLIFSKQKRNRRGHPLESSGQAGSCVFLISLFKKPSVVTF